MEEKHIDESWKDAAAKEKDTLKQQPQEEMVAPEATFSFFITTLALQASIALGVIPDPADNKKVQNFPQAKFLIDTLEMVQQKTKNNLTEEEAGLLENILYELRMQFVAVQKNHPA